MELSPTFMSLLALSSLLCVSASALSVVHKDELPKLSDTLTVAKSPLEPITFAPSAPGARNENLPDVAQDTSKLEPPERIQTTRSAFTAEQEKDGSDLGLESEDRSTSVEPTENSAVTDSTEKNESTSSYSESEQDSTTTKAEATKQPITVSATSTPQQPTTSSTATIVATMTTTTTQAPETTTVEEQQSSSQSPGNEQGDKVAISTIAPAEEVPAQDSVKVEPEPSSVAESITTNRPAQSESEMTPASIASLPKTKPEISSISSSELSTVESTTEATEAPTTKSASPLPKTTVEPQITTGSSAVPETTTIIRTTSSTTTTTPAPTTSTTEASTTTTQTPTTTEESATALTPTPTITTTTTATHNLTSTNSDDKRKVDQETKAKDANCNHLPTYESDEVQKVFREETTFKNGTIKGKFTYINFDQRYRLVHYTRLPYGPVKIDLVEELGKPESNDDGSVQPITSETPNSVLQLRNILPNSLFGFPFVGSNAANNNRVPATNQRSGDNNHRSPNHFYSSPDLINEQRSKQSNRPAAQLDTFGSSFYENLPVGGVHKTHQHDSTSSLKPKFEVASEDASLPVQNHLNQFQYATSVETGKLPQGLLYNFLPQPQFAPIPFYSFHHPAYYHHARELSLAAQQQQQHQVAHSSNKLKLQRDPVSEVSLFSHQPHSHEHYVAPFMFAQPPSAHVAQPEASRLKLKVKTSKALNDHHQAHGFVGKSAQLRSMTGPSYSMSINNPAQIVPRQQRQRSGKQSHDLKPVINSTPVVYHVLRSPVGHMYSLPQYNQAHAMAYDHDD